MTLGPAVSRVSGKPVFPDAICVHGPAGLFAPSRTKVIGSLLSASLAVLNRTPVTTEAPLTGVTVRPVLISSKFKYLVAVVSSKAFPATSAAGWFVEEGATAERAPLGPLVFIRSCMPSSLRIQNL